MMTNTVNFETVLFFIDKYLEPTYLNPTQEIVLREVWNGKTYSEMADRHNYDPEYIKSVGCNLWKILSQVFEQQINKSNFVPFMRQRIAKANLKKRIQPSDNLSQTLSTEVEKGVKNRQIYHWTTAPCTKDFLGREEEIKTLDLWSQKPNCNCIIVSGMVGSGKTTLATKFARKSETKFDYIIWFSLQSTPSLATLINNYLKIINPQINIKSLEISLLLSEFISYLKNYKILLVLDNLEEIFEDNKGSFYKQNHLEYRQFLESIIAAEHQSLLIANSRIKPKMLEYYARSQVKFLNLQGLKYEASKKILKSEPTKFLNEQNLAFILRTLQNNPQLLKIVDSHLHLESFLSDNIEHAAEELSFLEPIINLLELELSCLSSLEKEIVYWLAISDSFITLKQLNHYIEHSQVKLKISNSINYLIERSLIVRNDSNYALIPIMKIYLRRKLVKQACHN